MHLDHTSLKNINKTYYESYKPSNIKPAPKRVKKIIPKQATPIEQPEEISPHDAEIDSINKKADKIKALAGLIKAKNDYKRAKIDGEDIDKGNTPEEEEVAVYPKQPDPDQQQEGIDLDDRLTEDYSDSPGMGDCNNNEIQIAETVFEAEAVQEPQTKEEADIAKTQAETEKIKSEAEGSAGGMGEEGLEDDGLGDAGGMGDPTAGGDPGSAASMGMGMDPMGGMGNQQDPNDPLAGFGETTSSGDDSGMGSMGGMGMGGEPSTDKTPTAIGRIYMLTKLYYRLSALTHILVNNPDKELLDLTNKVRESFEIFQIVISNLKNYKSKIDDVIIMYYQFLKEVVKYLAVYYRGKYNTSE